MEKSILTNDVECPNEIMKVVKDFPIRNIDVGRSGDKVFAFGDKYLLKISTNIEELRLEKDKTEWISERIGGPRLIKYIEDDNYGYYLRTYLHGHTLIEEQYTSNPERMISILKKVVNVLRSLDSSNCPFKSLENEGNDFVHGDLCLPNIVVDDEDNFISFLDVSNAGLGDKMFDYCWLLWSFEYNLKTDHYNDLLLKELGITISQDDYERYVVAIHNND